MSTARHVQINQVAHPRHAVDGSVMIGVLGVNWSEGDLGGLESLAQVLRTLPSRVQRLEFSHCLGLAHEVTPVNVYRRLRLRVKQMENTLRHDDRLLQELQVRFYVQRRDGSQPTVEICRVSPTENVGFSDRIQEFMVRNRLTHQAQELAEPTGTVATSSSSSIATTTTQDAATATTEALSDEVAVQPADRAAHRATWGLALVRLVARRDLDITSSAMFTLLQKCPDYIPRY